MDARASYEPPTVDTIFNDIKGRRAGMVKALTIDVEKFYQQCAPEKENLCLYGFPNNQWEVSIPPKNVPSEMPEPTLGINYVRDMISKKDWLSMVAMHSDSWLLALFSYFGHRFGFNKTEREQLFDKINNLPTILEVVTKKAKKKGKKRSRHQGKYSKAKQSRAKDENDEEEDKTTLCGLCEKNYVADGFWICCDFCDKWFHGKCVKITPAKAEHINKYKCPTCSKRARAR